MVLDEITGEGRLFQTGIVLGKREFFRASLQANSLVYCDSYDARVRFRLGGGVRYLSLWRDTVDYSNHLPIFREKKYRKAYDGSLYFQSNCFRSVRSAVFWFVNVEKKIAHRWTLKDMAWHILRYIMDLSLQLQIIRIQCAFKVLFACMLFQFHNWGSTSGKFMPPLKILKKGYHVI